MLYGQLSGIFSVITFGLKGEEKNSLGPGQLVASNGHRLKKLNGKKFRS